MICVYVIPNTIILLLTEGNMEDMNKGISIITNFGCDNNCWYCIWRGHSLEKCNTDTDWKKLTDFLTKYKNKGKVSISGGGDPLCNFYGNIHWWRNLFLITKQLDIKVDVHTRTIKLHDDGFWRKINRVSFSIDKPPSFELHTNLYGLLSRTKVRLVHTVTKDTTIATIDSFLEFQSSTGCQITLKELAKHDDKGRYNELKSYLKDNPRLHFLDAGDYNLYYMPDNKVYDKFQF